MPTYFRLLWEIFSFPFTRMKSIVLKDTVNKEFHQNLLNPDEVIISCYDNIFKSFLITNMRIVSIQKFRVATNVNLASKIFSIPLNQVGTVEMFALRFFDVHVLRITSAPGFKFYWFFKKTVSMLELVKIIVKVADDVQGISKSK